MKRSPILAFLETDAAGGLVLLVCAAIALVVANSPAADTYHHVLEAPLHLDLVGWSVHLTTEEWIKDGLMTIFFFVVGLELKRELVVGELSDIRAVVLPVAAAFGGMIAPALVYLVFNAGGDMRGWPVPVATDIAFAVAALAVIAPRAPSALRIFLLTLAVADDLGAVVLIAVLFSKNLAFGPLAVVFGLLAAMTVLGRWKGAPALLFVFGSVLVWAFALSSGVHTSVAGVAAAFTVPLMTRGPERPSILQQLETATHPISAYVVLPLFAFASAGISLKGLTLADLTSSVPLGIALGLAVGKPIGVVLASYGVVRLGLARLPSGTGLAHMFGVACLCGIGFTMSLFLGALAFSGDNIVELEARIGIMAGSLLALAFGALAFALAKRRQESAV